MSGLRVCNVLLVEDSSDDDFIFRHALGKTGFSANVQTVASPGEAIAYLHGANPFSDRTAHPYPDLVFTDMEMGAYDGFDLLRWMRANVRPGSLFTIVLSGSQLPSSVASAYALGASAVILKPAGAAELSEILKAALQFFSFCERAGVGTAHT